MNRPAPRRAVTALIGATSVCAAALVAGPVAVAATTGTANFVCTTPATPDATYDVTVEVDATAIPATEYAGRNKPAGAWSIPVDLTIPANLSNTLLFFGITSVGGHSEDFALPFGSKSLGLQNVSTAPQQVTQDQTTTLHADASNKAFQTPAAGARAIAMPSTFTYTTTKQDGSDLTALTCNLAPSQTTALGSISLAKRSSTTKATTVLTPVRKTHHGQVRAVVTPTPSGRIASGKVVARIGTRTVGSATLSKGKAVITLALLSPGTYTVTVRYSGDAYTKVSTGKSTIKVIR